MSDEKSEVPDLNVPIYSDNEVGIILLLQQRVFALDDAIYNQEQLKRPETFIKPLEEIRAGIAMMLKQATAKSMQKKAEESPT